MMAKHLLSSVMAIYVAGAVLKLVGDGMFGTTAQKAAKYVTSGFGV